MDLKDGNLGLLRINNVVRLSMRQASYHKIECYLFSYMNDELWQNIQKSVTNRVIFNKEAYFNDSIVLLQYDSYTALQQAYETKTDIILNYFKMYYDLTLETIVKKNYQYDPYIVEFLQRHISITESKKRPFQHVHPLPTYEQSIWSVLENKNYKNLSDCLCKVQIEKYRPSAFHVGMNALYDKSYILLSNTGTANYIFSEDFYKNTLTAISDFDIENILIKLLVQNEININSTLNLITDFRNLDDELKFYHLPLYLYLLNNIINRLLKGEQP